MYLLSPAASKWIIHGVLSSLIPGVHMQGALTGGLKPSIGRTINVDVIAVYGMNHL